MRRYLSSLKSKNLRDISWSCGQSSKTHYFLDVMLKQIEGSFDLAAIDQCNVNYGEGCSSIGKKLTEFAKHQLGRSIDSVCEVVHPNKPDHGFLIWTSDKADLENGLHQSLRWNTNVKEKTNVISYGGGVVCLTSYEKLKRDRWKIVDGESEEERWRNYYENIS